MKAWEKTLKPGDKWSGEIAKGKYIEFTAEEAGANLSLLMYNRRDISEKYNMPDTLKGQKTAHLTVGNVLFSDNGRVLASIVEDSLGWNDTISGYTTREMTEEKYGHTTYQDEGNEWYRCGEENFSVELFRNNMDLRDLVPCVNLFSKVYCEEDGSMHYDETHCKKGDKVVLRTEMDVILVVSNTPNPLDERETYPSVPVTIKVTDAPKVEMDDVCLNHRPENYRAFENTWDYYSLIEE